MRMRGHVAFTCDVTICFLSDEAGGTHTNVDQWINTLSEHNTLLQEWKKAWVRGKSHFLMFNVEF